jgi:unsaturated chondroitin disaccharide hydrolase
MGILWLLYLETDEAFLSELADQLEAKMDIVLNDSESTDHDVGFIWGLSSVANYKITGSKEARRRGLIAANYLLSRFNPTIGFITAWNSTDRQGWSIIDTIMNLSLLYWAGKETGYKRYTDTASRHADKTAENIVRADGSVNHIVEYDLNDGHMKQALAGQGFAVGSSWTRGQAWAIYGFALSYLHLGTVSYLDTAKKVAHYFLSAAAAYNYVPPVDFRSPAEPLYFDTTASAIAACGLLEISRALNGTHEAELYFEGAVRLLKALENGHVDFCDKSDALLHNASAGYPPRQTHIDIIYGDYFYMEAFFKLCGKDYSLW